ncbi:helix-turn-helix domain-containing protein [Streptomyces chiangmaiensis]|uniref:helix-turn-helix domain-containing protein n=1 Tax=Streptomyces chiangmaiensis TaxID=766497 RepID=UPI002E34E6B7|nr:XRE family transcriptional regulator [Streptomyces chiangmaiensis]
MATRRTAAASAEPSHESGTGGAVPHWQAVVSAIGPKVRELRTQLGLSLQQLAGRAEVSAAAIYKIERSDMVPTVTTLLKLASALERPVGYFIEEETTDPASAVYIPAGERKVVKTRRTGVELADISGPSERFRVNGVVATLPPGARGSEWSPARPGEELVLVLDGAVDFTVGEQEFALKQGDALHYLASCRYSWTNPHTGSATLAWIKLHDDA